MTEIATPLFTYRVKAPISSCPLLVDADDDGWPEIFVGGPAFHGLRWDGERLPRWPQRGRRPFASSAAYGDILGEDRGALVIGCDDGRVYAFHVDGDLVAGWPVRTGRDVFSTPALSDLDQDNALEIVIGSDDGTLYVLRGDGRVENAMPVPGRPFVSASPTVVGSGAGEREIVFGAWNRCVYAWSPRGDASLREIHRAQNIIWSSASAFGIEGRGEHIAWAADGVFVTDRNGRAAEGWPRRTNSWMVSSPAIVELRKGDGATVLVGAERLYAFDLAGRLRPGWPSDVGDFVWASPIAFDLDGDGSREVIVGSWDGGIYAFRSDGSLVGGFPLRTEGPIFSTPAAAPLAGDGGLLVACSWDGSVRAWRLPAARFAKGDWLQLQGSPERTGRQDIRFPRPTPTEEIPPEETASPALISARQERWHHIMRIVLEGHRLERARCLRVAYALRGERRSHPTPVVNSGGKMVALVQPVRTPRLVRFSVELVDDRGIVRRWPVEGEASFLSWPRWLSFARRGETPPPSDRSSRAGESGS